MGDDPLASWSRGEHTGNSLRGATLTFPTYRKGTGPGVVVVHEVPGLIPAVVSFAEEVVAAGFTVVLPHLFGRAPESDTIRATARSLRQVCVSREFVTLATRSTSPVAGWLRSLARELHSELGGPGVGALGMCLTGGFALAMMVDDAVAAPVVCQPSTPFALTPGRARDLNLSDPDLARVVERAAGGCQVLGLQYEGDPATGKRFDRLQAELGDAFIRVDFPGRKHSTVTRHRRQEGVERVLAFLGENLSG